MHYYAVVNVEILFSLLYWDYNKKNDSENSAVTAELPFKFSSSTGYDFIQNFADTLRDLLFQ